MLSARKLALGAAAAAVVLASLLVSGVPPAFASTIGPSCGTCQGSTYTLTYAVEGVSGGNTTYDVTLSIDSKNFLPTGGGTGPFYIDSTAIKVSSQDPLDPTTLDSAPGGTGKWVLFDGPVNGTGCQSITTSGLECSTTSTSLTKVGAFNQVGGTLTWTWDIVLNSSNPLITSANGATIKARYVNGSDKKVGDLVSETITLTAAAEPASTLLLSVAMLVGGVFRKKLFA